MPQDKRFLRTFSISWEQLHRDSRALAWKLLDIGEFNGIIAITRGGLVPAAVVARELNIRLIDTVCISTYDYQKPRDSISVLKPTNPTGKGWLIIDDLVDTGKTAAVVRKMAPHAHFATVYAKPLGKPMVDTYITEVSQKTWILFPWDSGAEFVRPIAEQRLD